MCIIYSHNRHIYHLYENAETERMERKTGWDLLCGELSQGTTAKFKTPYYYIRVRYPLSQNSSSVGQLIKHNVNAKKF